VPSPWHLGLLNRMRIYLRSLAEELCAGARMYADAVAEERPLHEAFESAMKLLYPSPL
jgi:hypothetical protein